MFRRKEKLPGPINYLPEETLHHLVSFASTKSQMSLRQTNRFFYAALTTTDFLKAQSDYSKVVRDLLSQVSMATLKAIDEYLSVNSDKFFKKMGIRRAIFYQAVMRHSDATPRIKAIAVFCLLQLEGGRELKQGIMKLIPIDIKHSIMQALDHPDLLVWSTIVKKFSMLCYQYSSDEFHEVAKCLVALQQEPGIKNNIVAHYGGELCDVYRYINDNKNLNINLVEPLMKLEYGVIDEPSFKR